MMDGTFAQPIVGDPVIGFNVVRVEFRPKETTITIDIEHVHQSGQIDPLPSIVKTNGATYSAALGALTGSPDAMSKLIAWLVADGDLPALAPPTT